MAVEIIADGAHLPASLLKLIYKVKGPGKIALVSDSMRSAGMPEGESILGSLHGGQKVIVENGVAKLTDKSAFAGSVATGERLIRTMRDIADVPLIHAVQMATTTPAQIIGISGSKGTLAVGKDADIVIFDENISVHMTIVGGRIVYKKY
jgi:N-acetylglucosamine-6-phosphate deacetylase